MRFDMPNCGGCRTCEMACSFKHTGQFIPSISSIKIVEKKDDPTYEVLLSEKTEGEVPACDGCQEVGEPLCVQYCGESETLAGIIHAFIKRAKPVSKTKKGATDLPLIAP